jgi:glycosyltransferase involved in cell wall biosynthesis
MTAPTQRPSIQYSYCLTTKNCVTTIEECLRSILSKNDANSEVVVVDSKSRDGTAEVLERYRVSIRLVSVECGRGRGRQIAFEHATGRYIVVLDGDTTLQPAVLDFLSFYHARFEGFGFLLEEWNADFRAHSAPFFIAPAYLIRAAGGWRDTPHREDDDLYGRLAAMGKFRFTYGNPIVRNLRKKSTWLGAIKDVYIYHEFGYKFGYSIPWRSRALPIALLAYVSHLCNRRTSSQFDNPAARAITKISRTEPFLVRLHRAYNCYASISELVSALDQRYNNEHRIGNLVNN